MTVICSGLVVQVVPTLLCNSWRDFDWHISSLSSSAVAEFIVFLHGKLGNNYFDLFLTITCSCHRHISCKVLGVLCLRHTHTHSNTQTEFMVDYSMIFTLDLCLFMISTVWCMLRPLSIEIYFTFNVSKMLFISRIILWVTYNRYRLDAVLMCVLRLTGACLIVLLT